MIPDRITFYDLHRIIQILFGWTDYHLHDFFIPSVNIYVGDGSSEDLSDLEKETLVDSFLPQNKWIRYTYDFGDDWRHKIFFEKTDASYTERHPSLRKAKGDNFREDSGGVWAALADEEAWEEDEENREHDEGNRNENGDEREADAAFGNRLAFDEQAVRERLNSLHLFPRDELLKASEHGLSDREINKLSLDFLQKLIKSVSAPSYRRFSPELQSALSLKLKQWEDFLRDSLQPAKAAKSKEENYSQMVLPFIQEESLEEPMHTLRIAPGSQKCAELLQAIGRTELLDYCKYLQLSYDEDWNGKQLANAVAEAFHHHPEYLLYVLTESEYQEYLRLASQPPGRLIGFPEHRTEGQPPEQTWTSLLGGTIYKSLALGLADISFERKKGKTTGILTFVSDIPPLLASLTDTVRKRTYQELERLMEKLQNIILVYGAVDFDNLQDMFRRIYRTDMDPADFRRFLYLHAKGQGLIDTCYTLNSEKQYAVLSELDAEAILTGMRHYADDLDYVFFSAKKLKKKSENISERSDWNDILFDLLHFDLNLTVDAASAVVEDLFPKILNGDSLPDIMEWLFQILPAKPDLVSRGKLWNSIEGLMLDVELPMLKGRSRSEYGKEKNVSPWDVNMIKTEPDFANVRERPMHTFPRKIQEAMSNSLDHADDQDLDLLWNYQKEQKIHSEEFLYLLTLACIASAQFEKGGKLLRKLQNCSDQGMKAVQELLEIMNDMADALEEPEEEFEAFEKEEPLGSQPYIRKTPKIGRNDPCPCGSGKKYKKCCGRNL